MLKELIHKFFAKPVIEDTPPLMSYRAFARTLSPNESPVFDTRVGGFIIVSRPDLGVFKKSDGDALEALAREQGIRLVY